MAIIPNKNMKLAFFSTKPYEQAVFKPYEKDFGIQFRYFNRHLTKDTAVYSYGCDAVCAFVNDTVNATVIDELVQCGVKVLALRCAGYNNVDLEYAKGKLTVVRVPAYSPYAVAEHAASLLLTAVRHIHKAYIRTREFNFSLNGLVGFDLHGKTVGIIGEGKIGQIFMNICRGFGMKLLVNTNHPRGAEDVEYVSVDEICRRSDIISLHCPLFPETMHLINAERIAMMKDGVVIVNISRGALIDSNALIDGLKSRKIAAAALDVYEDEGALFYEDYSEDIVLDDTIARLISMPNVIVTSHQGFLTRDALESIAKTTVENLKAFERGEKSGNELV